MASWQDFLERNAERFLKDYLEFLRIPSISSLPEHTADVAKAGDWVANRLKAAGIEAVRVMETGGHPVVYGEWLHAENQPTVLIYGHFDVQPVDPLVLWNHPPFEPTIENGRVYARGATDDKGSLLPPILAAEAWLKTENRLPVNVKFFFEGQEEIGSPQLADFVANHTDLLKCDMVFSADGGQWEEDQPAILMGLRGLCACQIDVRGAKSDLHSGTYGGTILNPIHALSKILAGLHDADARVRVPGFYDDVETPGAYDNNRLEKIPFEEADFLDKIGARALHGEVGFSTLQRAWLRPTLEVNGIWGGFQGEGTKTVLPAEAHAKISCRLVPNQKAADIRERVMSYIQEHSPAGVHVTVTPQESLANPYRIPHDHSGNQVAREVHRKLYGTEPIDIWMGGSIPVCGLFLEHLGAYTVNFAFGLNDEGAHAPNEFFRLSGFNRGQRAYGMLFERLAS